MNMQTKIPARQARIFSRGSKTYFNSSVFFPAAARRDVTVLYGFVRVADDFVDATPPQPAEFFAFRDAYRLALAGTPSGDPVIDDFVELAQRKRFDPAWTEDFLKSMESDLTKKTYESLEELLPYIWGSAEVIGLFLSKILDLPERAWSAASRLGRSMQYINFLRDIAEDYGLGRRYLPLESTALADLHPDTCAGSAAEFRRFLRSQVARYTGWQAEAVEGYRWIPRRYLIPIKTASDLYNWTARVIQNDPMVVWRRKVKPSLLRIFVTLAANLFYWPPRPRNAR
jgi:phytoene synthase